MALTMLSTFQLLLQKTVRLETHTLHSHSEVQVWCSRPSEIVLDACVPAPESQPRSHLKDSKSIFTVKKQTGTITRQTGTLMEKNRLGSSRLQFCHIHECWSSHRTLQTTKSGDISVWQTSAYPRHVTSVHCPREGKKDAEENFQAPTQKLKQWTHGGIHYQCLPEDHFLV